ncbi:hypothetical protein Tco_1446123 [Tanacetum coccineum]
MGQIGQGLLRESQEAWRGDRRYVLRDTRRYKDVLDGKKHDVNDASTGCWKNEEEVVRRTMEVRNDEVDTEVLERSLIAEVKKLGYLARLSEFCQEEGLINVEVKVLGGMEVMLVFDTMETACNILCDTKHGIRR